MSKTLEQIENDDWGEPEFDSHLVKTCHRLRRKPLEEFTTEDFRIMIGQNISLEHLVPRAIEKLREEPLAEGDYYGGDLLSAVIKCDLVSHDRSDICSELAIICTKAIEQIETYAADQIFQDHCG